MESNMSNPDDHNPEREDLWQFFAYAHLPAQLQEVSALFSNLARTLIETAPRCPERTAGLRKLLEAKDCAVRAKLWKPPGAR